MSFTAIRTDRLLLRPARPADAAALAARRSVPEVAALQSWETPYPLERAESLVARLAEMNGPVSDEWWMLTIATPDDTSILGDLAIHPTWDGRSVEIGYSLAPEAWGHGYAVEAVDALIRRLFEDPAVTRVHAMLHPDNIASAQVLERTGFVFEGRTRLSFWVGDENTDDLLYGMTREQWTDWQERPRHPPADVRLVEITPDTARSVLALTTHKSQERFVSTMAKSFADAMFPELFEGAPVVPWMRAIEADGALVGFVMVTAVTHDQPEPYLWRLLIDRRHQRRGIGRRTVELVLDICRSWGASSVLVSWGEGRGSPAPLYLDLGFVLTGGVDDGEVEARLAFDRDDTI